MSVLLVSMSHEGEAAARKLEHTSVAPARLQVP